MKSNSWFYFMIAGVIFASVIYELFTGIARVRGIGTFSRTETPMGYCLVLLLKFILAAGIAAVPFISHL